jgi:hypothetical protein
MLISLYDHKIMINLKTNCYVQSIYIELYRLKYTHSTDAQTHKLPTIFIAEISYTTYITSHIL